MTRQEFLNLRETARREQQKRELRTLLLAAGALVVCVPAVAALGHYIIDHPEGLIRAVQGGWRYFLGAVAGTGMLLLALLATRLKLLPPGCHRGLSQSALLAMA